MLLPKYAPLIVAQAGSQSTELFIEDLRGTPSIKASYVTILYLGKYTEVNKFEQNCQ